jgi:hypothetical protein
VAGCFSCLGLLATDGWGVTRVPAGQAQNATLRMPRGQATKRFAISALASHSYDVTVTAPATAAVAVTMNEGVGTRWTLDSLHGQGCHTSAGRATCLLHFAAGGNPGGTWTGVVHKTSILAVRVKVSIAFNKN